MKGESMPIPFLILGDGPSSHALAAILRAPRVGRRPDDDGWDWPAGSRRGAKPVEAIRFLLTADPALGVSQWIRRHAEARRHPVTVARRAGVLLFGMSPEVAEELRRRDVFARTGGSADADQTLGTWEPDLMMMDDRSSLGDLISGLAALETIPQSTWERLWLKANCLPRLLDAITRRDPDALGSLLGDLNRIDWDARCFPHPVFGDPHAWANRIRRWLGIVTASVPPDWEEGLALFLPLERKTA